jgi:outer membrane lipoprotein SlyB
MRTAAALLTCIACARTTATSSTTRIALPAPCRPGTVETAEQTIRHSDRDPVSGALIGAAIGLMLFEGNGAGAFVGATTGAVLGATAGDGSVETRTCEMRVRFDDGMHSDFVYRDDCPFTPGARVELTPHGLRAAVAKQ